MAGRSRRRAAPAYQGSPRSVADAMVNAPSSLLAGACYLGMTMAMCAVGAAWYGEVAGIV